MDIVYAMMRPSKVYVRDIIDDDIIWYKFGPKLAKYAYCKHDVAIQLTAAYIASKDREFEIDYESTKDIELMHLINYFEDRFQKFTLNSLHLITLENMVKGDMINDIFIEEETKCIWVPVGVQFYQMSTIEVYVGGFGTNKQDACVLL